MATKKAKRAVGLAKREAFLAEERAVGLAAQQADKERRQAIEDRYKAQAVEHNRRLSGLNLAGLVALSLQLSQPDR